MLQLAVILTLMQSILKTLRLKDKEVDRVITGTEQSLHKR